MKKRCIAFGLAGFGLVAFTLTGCSSAPDVNSSLATSSSTRLGAGDSIGLDLQRSDRVIAKYDPYHRLLASQWGE